MALVRYSHLPCGVCSMYRSVAIHYNHHGVVCQLLRQYRACVVYLVLWYIHSHPYLVSLLFKPSLYSLFFNSQTSFIINLEFRFSAL